MSNSSGEGTNQGQDVATTTIEAQADAFGLSGVTTLDGGTTTSHHALPSSAAPPPPQPSRAQKLLAEDVWREERKRVEAALNELISLSFKGDENSTATAISTEIDEVGGAAILVGVMKKWQAHSRIQSLLCQLLINLTSTVSCLPFTELWFGVGGLDIVVDSMKRFPFIHKLQCNACGLLANVVMTTKWHADHLVNKLVGHEMVISAMIRFPYAARLQHYACTVLQTVSQWDGFKKAIVKAGGDLALVNAIKNNTNESEHHVKELQKSARQTFIYLKCCLACHEKLSRNALYCSKCNNAPYCSKECQRKDWKRHKQTDCVNDEALPAS